MIFTSVCFPDNNKVYVIENFFSDDLANRLLAWFADHAIEPSHWQSLDKFSHVSGRLVRREPHPLLDQAQDHASSDAVISFLSDLVRQPLTLSSVEAWVDLENYAIRPHLDYMDHSFKFYGLQVYFAQKIDFSQGTCFYHRDQPILNLPLRQNLAYFLDRGDTVSHGLAHPVPPGQHRYSLHFKYSIK